MKSENNDFDKIGNLVTPCGTTLLRGVTPTNLKEGFFSALKGYVFDLVKPKCHCSNETRHSEGANFCRSAGVNGKAIARTFIGKNQAGIKGEVMIFKILKAITSSPTDSVAVATPAAAPFP